MLSLDIAHFTCEGIEMEGCEIHMGQSVCTGNGAVFIHLEDRLDSYYAEEKQLIGTYF